MSAVLVVYPGFLHDFKFFGQNYTESTLVPSFPVFKTTILLLFEVTPIQRFLKHGTCILDILRFEHILNPRKKRCELFLNLSEKADPAKSTANESIILPKYRSRKCHLIPLVPTIWRRVSKKSKKNNKGSAKLDWAGLRK